jgi:NAD(P)-dependent dehydrogenase (short-subunit alcohol dehydrogenase family)
MASAWPEQHVTQKVALITGAGSGMGQAYARRLLRDGWTVAALDVNREGLDALGQMPGLVTFVVDVRDERALHVAVREVESTLGPLTRVVNAAAIMPLGSLLDTDAATVGRIVDINFLGLVRLSRATMPGMLARGRGEFVSFASISGQIPIFFMGAYGASKSAVIAYTETLEQETRGRGVQVLCVCPPAVKTPLLEQGRATRWPRFLDVFPAISADSVLDAVERALRRRRAWVYPGWYTRPSLWVRRMAPGLLWWLVRLVERPDEQPGSTD